MSGREVRTVGKWTLKTRPLRTKRSKATNSKRHQRRAAARQGRKGKTMSGINFKQNPITIMKDKDGPGFGFIVVGHGASLTFQSFAKCDGCGLGCKSEVKLDLFNPGGNLAGMSWRTTLPKDWRSVPGPENSGTTVDTCPDCIAKTP